jgi:hypothetical protein
VPLFEPKKNPLESIKTTTARLSHAEQAAQRTPNLPPAEAFPLEPERFSLDPSHRPVTLQSPLDHFDLASSLPSVPVGLPWFMRFLPVQQELHTQRLQSWELLQKEALASGLIDSIEQPRSTQDEPTTLLPIPETQESSPAVIDDQNAQKNHALDHADDFHPHHLAPESASELRHLRRGGRRPRYRGRDRDRRPHAGS